VCSFHLPDISPYSSQAPYTDPTTGIRYHDKSVYEIVKGLVGVTTFFAFIFLKSSVQSTSMAKDFLAGELID